MYTNRKNEDEYYSNLEYIEELEYQEKAIKRDRPDLSNAEVREIAHQLMNFNQLQDIKILLKELKSYI